MSKAKGPQETGYLHAYENSEFIRESTYEELVASVQAAEIDGGRGIIEILIDGEQRRCYVVGDLSQTEW